MTDHILIPTKIHRPYGTDDLLERHRLTSLLDAGFRQPVTLVAAPAGYGKTSIVSLWLNTDRPSAWFVLLLRSLSTRSATQRVRWETW